jgi:hypothetical protein
MAARPINNDWKPRKIGSEIQKETDLFSSFALQIASSTQPAPLTQSQECS